MRTKLHLVWGFINGQQLAGLPLSNISLSSLAGGWDCSTLSTSLHTEEEGADESIVSIAQGWGFCLSLKRDGSVWHQQEALPQGQISAEMTAGGEEGGRGRGERYGALPASRDAWLPVHLPFNAVVVELAAGKNVTAAHRGLERHLMFSALHLAAISG
jgi:hypothetical protein